MSEQVAPSAVAQHTTTTTTTTTTTKFLTNENVKPAGILKRLRAQFGDETLTRIQVYDWGKSFKAEQRLKTCEDYTFCK
jgi:hypothetical protein